MQVAILSRAPHCLPPTIPIKTLTLAPASSLTHPDAPTQVPLMSIYSPIFPPPHPLHPLPPGDPPPIHAPGTSAAGEVFLAFGRVFSGTAREGARVHVLSSAYDPLDPTRHRQTAVLQGLYLMMGRALERLREVPAGNVLAIAGLETAVLKSATLASTPCAAPLAPMVFQVGGGGGWGRGLSAGGAGGRG